MAEWSQSSLIMTIYEVVTGFTTGLWLKITAMNYCIKGRSPLLLSCLHASHLQLYLPRNTRITPQIVKQLCKFQDFSFLPPLLPSMPPPLSKTSTNVMGIHASKPTMIAREVARVTMSVGLTARHNNGEH